MNELAIKDNVIIEKTIDSQEERFNSIANGLVNFKREALFAKQLVCKNNFAMKIAKSNPESLMNAIVNVAAVGLTLNPAQNFAYLIPRDGVICLDLSYIGIVKIATDCEAVKWCQAELVYDKDSFKYMGPGQKPQHEFDPFSERGEIRGVYCVVKLNDNDFLSEVMSLKDLYEIREKSQAWAAKKSGPWKDYFGEMAKKTVIKRASKLWPRSAKAERLQTAIDVLDMHEGSNFEEEKITENQTLILQSHLTKIENGEARLIKHLSTKYGREIKACDDLSKSEADYAIRFVEQYI